MECIHCGIGMISCCIGADGRARGCPELPPTVGNIAGNVQMERFARLDSAGIVTRDSLMSLLNAENVQIWGFTGGDARI
ncbi:MAG: hypothetical protein M0Q92_08110 [Methanoregula sp.]|jgi:MoaA/NifB/PqqE/SkfB family radical SAM enzyme|nr:hypothetical protein [Methanoregula sp.]